jgi:hypothetical protein
MRTETRISGARSVSQCKRRRKPADDDLAFYKVTLSRVIRSRFRGQQRRKTDQELDALRKGKVRAALISVNRLKSMTFLKKSAIFGKSPDFG